MTRNFKGHFNKVVNGDFSRKSKTQANFPEAWLQIAGGRESSWVFKYESPWEIPMLEISNTTAIRAGIIQNSNVSLDVRKAKEWLVRIVMKADQPDRQAYLRVFPTLSNGDVSQPWEYCFDLGGDQKQVKQVISTDSDIQSLRLEVGILGSGIIKIYQVIAYSLTPNKMTRHVKRSQRKVCSINSIQSIGEIVKPIQLAAPIPLKIPVDLLAKVNADVRNLTPIRDKVQIFGSSQVPIATSVSGRVQVEINGHGFYESLEDVKAGKTIKSTITRDISALPRCSFAVWNYGDHLANVQAELSPDGVHWIEEGTPKEISPGKLIIISPKNFLRYTRLTYCAEESTGLRIWVQAQN